MEETKWDNMSKTGIPKEEHPSNGTVKYFEIHPCYLTWQHPQDKAVLIGHVCHSTESWLDEAFLCNILDNKIDFLGIKATYFSVKKKKKGKFLKGISCPQEKISQNYYSTSEI